jgi:SAM-dependent methyltransferase
VDSVAWDERYAAAELVWSAGPNQFVEQALTELSPGRALDLACGEGRNARWLAEQGWQVTAMDFSPVAIEKGRRMAGEVGDRLADRIDWQVGDALDTALPSDLDLVVIAYLQIPAAERTEVMCRAFAALAPGGHLFVVGHDTTNLTEGTGGPPDPAVLYEAADVLDDLAGEELEVVRAERVARIVQGVDEHGSEGTAWDVLVHVHRPGGTG